MLRTKSTFFYQQNYTVQKNGKKRYKRFFVEDEAEFDIPLVSSSDEFPVAFLVKQKDENTGEIIEDVQNCFFHNGDFSSTDERDYYGYLPSEKEAMFALEKKEYAEYYSVSEEDVQIHDLENEIICLVPEINEKYPNIRQEEQAKLLQSLEKFLYKLEISSTLTDTEKQCYQQTKKFRDDLIRI